MQRSDLLAVLAEHGIKGDDAETALDSWRFNPLGGDASRVHAVMAHVVARGDAGHGDCFERCEGHP